MADARDGGVRPLSAREHVRVLAAQTAVPFADVLGTLSEGVLVADAGGRVTYANAAALDALRATGPDAVGSELHDVVHADTCGPACALRAPGRSRAQEGVFRRTDGTWIDVAYSATPVDGGVVLAFRDTTERRRLRAANDELEAFAYSVSHDLRAPVRAVEYLSNAVLEDHADAVDEAGRDTLRKLADEAGRLRALVECLFALSRVGRERMERREADVGAIAGRIARRLREAHPGRDVRLVVSETAPCAADPALLEILLENLLANAWKFTAGREPALVEVGCAPTPTGPAYFVRDNGAGFDMADVGRLFRPFERLHDRREFEGTGIGLATVQRVVARHGGRVWAEGKRGEGATFWFTLGALPP